jgi:hypothetical protein
MDMRGGFIFARIRHPPTISDELLTRKFASLLYCLENSMYSNGELHFKNLRVKYCGM